MKKIENIYLQYGGGSTVAPSWVNFDVAPMLWFREKYFFKPIIPIYNFLNRYRRKPIYPPNVYYGDIVSGFPKYKGKCKVVFCSHVLEHLSLFDFRIALKQSYDLLQNGGHFRIVVPDLEYYARTYLANLDNGVGDASIDFMRGTYLGLEKKGGLIKDALGYFLFCNHHFWMWDKLSLEKELLAAGFTNIAAGTLGSINDDKFKELEHEDRFVNAVVLDCYKFNGGLNDE